ncbi:MAG: 7-cyano-7-deazaguanine synthase QueC [Candidatus Cloacimonadales bacterium]
MKGIVLVSGGIDSLVTAAIADQECEELYFLHLNYGQATESREMRAFRQLVKHYKPKDSLTVDIAYLKDIGGSSLVDKALQIKDYDGSAGVPNSYVPFRNGHLVTIATSWAEVLPADRIYIGAVEEDSSGYPDCRESFYQALEKAINLGTKDETKLQICTPIIHMRKAETIKLGVKLSAPLQLSWSCYRNNEIACGKCDSCVLRINSFKEAKLQDPIRYETKIDWELDV